MNISTWFDFRLLHKVLTNYPNSELDESVYIYTSNQSNDMMYLFIPWQRITMTSKCFGEGIGDDVPLS